MQLTDYKSAAVIIVIIIIIIIIIKCIYKAQDRRRNHKCAKPIVVQLAASNSNTLLISDSQNIV